MSTNGQHPAGESWDKFDPAVDALFDDDLETATLPPSGVALSPEQRCP